MKYAILFMLLVLHVFCGYKLGVHVTMKNVYDNCVASRINPVICSNYIKIIERKEWLLLKGLQ